MTLELLNIAPDENGGKQLAAKLPDWIKRYNDIQTVAQSGAQSAVQSTTQSASTPRAAQVEGGGGQGAEQLRGG